MAEPAEPVALRAATAADLAPIAAIFRRASLSNDGDREALMAHPEALEFGGEGISEGRTWVAVAEAGTITGFATWTPVGGRVAELEDLFVDPPWMRRGIATRLVEHLASVLAQSGFERIVVAANPHADRFYRSAGFASCGLVETELGEGTRMELVLG